MKFSELLPFPRGSTFYGGATPDANDLKGTQFEGAEYEVPDVNWSSGTFATLRSNRTVICRIMRNTSGGTLLPKRGVIPDFAGATPQIQMGSFAAYAGAGEQGGVIDEWLPAAGVVDDDLCYVVFRGPSKVTTAGSGDTNFAAGQTLKFTTNGLIVQADETQTAEAFKSIGRSLETINAISTDFVADIGAR